MADLRVLLPEHLLVRWLVNRSYLHSSLTSVFQYVGLHYKL
jgi:hypothetical protein